MFCFFLNWSLSTNWATWILNFIRNTTTFFTQVRVLIISITVWTYSNYIPIRQKFLVSVTIKLYNFIFINMSILLKFFENTLYKLSVFWWASFVKEIKFYVKCFKIFKITFVPIFNILLRCFPLFLWLY